MSQPQDQNIPDQDAQKQTKQDAAQQQPQDAEPKTGEEKNGDDAVKDAEKIVEDAESTAAEKATGESEKTTAEIEKLKAEVACEKDKQLRLMAEFDNFRRRTAKEQLELIETANAKLLTKLSEVLDNFERAAHPDNNKQKDYDSFAKGILLIHDQFAKILTDSGLEQIDPVGQPFDPNVHEALLNQPSDTVPESHVIQVFQKGYKLKNKLLKTAKVIVSSGPVSK